MATHTLINRYPPGYVRTEQPQSAASFNRLAVDLEDAAAWRAGRAARRAAAASPPQEAQVPDRSVADTTGSATPVPARFPA